MRAEVVTEPLAGWYRPVGARVAHYFDRFSDYSQCRYYCYEDRDVLVHEDFSRRCKACAKAMDR